MTAKKVEQAGLGDSDDLRSQLESAATRDRPGEAERSSASLARTHDDTDTMEREDLDFWAPPNTLRLPENDRDYVFRWIAEYVNGSKMPQRMSRARQMGWDFVKIDELPEGFYVDDDTGDGLARVGGLVMAKMPRARAAQRKAYYQRRSGEMLAGANQLQGIAGKDAVEENRGTRSLDGRVAGDALRTMARG